MKATIKKFWWGKTTTQRYGNIEQIKFYLFGKRGMLFLTQLNAVEKIEKQYSPIERIELSEITGEWLSNMEFEKFQNQLANQKNN